MKKRALGQIVFEFVSIVFAVMLALGLNSFKQSMDAEKEASAIESSILRECSTNLVKIDSNLSKNREYADYLDSLVALNPEDVNGFYFTYDFDLLANSAWQLSQNNSITNLINAEFLMEASEIYQTQEFYQEFSQQMFQNIGMLLARKNQLNDADLALSMYYNIGVMNNTAEDLKGMYADFLNKYNPKN